MMQPYQPKRRTGPEAAIQTAIVNMLRNYGWYTMETHGNAYQSGFPDIFACHSKYGTRWVEVKNPDAYGFTPAQLVHFPMMQQNGSGVWILTAATKAEYDKLFEAPNWYMYLKNIRRYVNPRDPKPK